MAHAHAADGIKNAARAGARSIEHGTFLDDEALALILEHDCWLVPTLTALPAVLLAGDAGARLNAESHRQAQELIDTHRASIRRAVEAGVKIAMGSDAGISAHGRNPDELAQMVECGLSPVEAIRCATDSAARLLGVDQETGTLEPGKRADVLVLDGSPLDVADIPARVRAVYKDGEVVVDRESATALVH
jgi:imidazolonepropionase-like amidohydrolase